MTKQNIIKAVMCIIIFILIMVLLILTSDSAENKVFENNETAEGLIEDISEVTVGVITGDNESGVYNVGSGVVVSKEGHIITNYSIVGNEHNNVVIVINNGRKISAVQIWKNEVMDLAVVKADYEFKNAIPLGDIKELAIGDKVYAVGKSVGAQFKNIVAEGIISGMYHTIATECRGENVLIEDLIQTDADIASGSRGGALVNINGELAGIIIMNNESFYAVPINIFAPIIKKIAKGEYVKNNTIGMYCYDSDMMQYMTQSFEDDSGVMTVYLAEGGSAEKSGIMPGDIITAIDGRAISNMVEFYEIVNSKNTGEEIVFDVKRGENSLRIKILGG